MAELSIPYVQRKLSTRSISGGGGVPGGASGTVGLPRVPDVSGLYRGTEALGQDITQIGEDLGKVAAAHQKARDTATLTSIESSLDEQVAAKAQEILRDGRIHPFDYRQTLATYRDSLLGSLDVSDRLKTLAQAKVKKSTQGYLIQIDAEGTKRGLQQAEDAFDQRASQIASKQLAETDDRQWEIRNDELATLAREYVASGIFSPTQAVAKMQGVRKTQLENQARLDPDGMEKILQQGPSALPGLNPADFAKLMDETRRVQAERWHFSQSQETEVRRQTEEGQKSREAEIFGQVQTGKVGLSGLNQLRDSRAISPAGYETAVRFMNQRIREGKAEAAQAQSLAYQRETQAYQREQRRNTEIDAQLGVLASTGQLGTGNEGMQKILNYAESKKLPARAIDGAVAKMNAYSKAQESEDFRFYEAAEKRLNSIFFKGPFDILTGEKQILHRNAIEELQRRSPAFKGTYGDTAKENPLTVVDEIIPKYNASMASDDTDKLDSLRDRLGGIESVQELEARRATMPSVAYEEKLRIFKQIDDIVKRNTPAPKPEASKGWLEGLKQRFMGGKPEQPIESTTTQQMGR